MGRIETVEKYRYTSNIEVEKSLKGSRGPCHISMNRETKIRPRSGTEVVKKKPWPGFVHR